MKNIITLKSLNLINFKGIKNLTINLDSQTDIFGANGTGKTTIADAFTWVLFGKDTSDRKDFEIKTLDAYGRIIPQIDHEVTAHLDINGEPLTIRRILKEDWVKKRGSETAEFKGNTTELYWNLVPKTTTEFSKLIDNLVEESVFKILSNPHTFCSNKVGSFGNSKIPMWQNRRNLLIDIFGEVSNEEVAKGNSAYENLLLKLTQGKTLEDYKNQILASIKKAKEDLKNIPSRIDEVFRGKPEAQDFVKLESDLKEKETSLEKIDSEIADANTAFNSKLDDQKGLKIKANDIKTEIGIIEANAKTEANKRLTPDTSVLDGLVKEKELAEQQLTSFENTLKTIETQKTGVEQQIKDTSEKMDKKRAEWTAENAKEITFNDEDFHCPTCKREFESGDVEAKKEEAIKNFKNAKTAKLTQINTEGGNLKSQKENLEAELKTLNERIETGKTSINTAKENLQGIIDKIDIENENNSTNGLEQKTVEEIVSSLLAANNKYQEKLLELESIEALIFEVPTTDNSELVEKRKGLVAEIDAIKAKLLTKTQIAAADKRIKELKDEETTLAQQIANVEKEQFVIENFIKAKVDALEQVVNSKFKFVKFKMFDEQINGGLKETCEAVINGVPYSDVNTASKINAGLDIINVLSEYYEISAPIFIDNAESVHTLIDTNSQLVRLVVSEQHKELLIDHKELVA